MMIQTDLTTVRLTIQASSSHCFAGDAARGNIQICESAYSECA